MKSGKYLCYLVWVLLLGSCQIEAQKSKYLRSVGDIVYDSTTDKKDFYLCNERNIKQYHNNYKGLEYKGEKIALIELFDKQFVPVPNSKDSGLIRIRFIVNCKGETDRFRVTAMDENYKEKEFDTKITQQLLLICKGLTDWIPKQYEDKALDYYQYLIFKIQNGKIIEIMP